ncbi:MAG: nucleophile aminohydrolase, partial [Olpidium bornovanus]
RQKGPNDDSKKKRKKKKKKKSPVRRAGAARVWRFAQQRFGKLLLTFAGLRRSGRARLHVDAPPRASPPCPAPRVPATRHPPATNGVVIVTEKKTTSPLIDESTLEKVVPVSRNAGLVYSGMGPDARVLIDKARKAVQAYKQVYMETPPVGQLVKEVAAVMQEYTQSGPVFFFFLFSLSPLARSLAQFPRFARRARSGVRPFGVSLLVAGYDDNGPALYQVDPSGSYWAWKASAIGKNMVNAKTFLEKRFSPDMEIEDAVHTAILTLKEGFEGQMTETSIEIGIISDTRGPGVIAAAPLEEDSIPQFRKLKPAEIRDYLANIA